MCVFMIVKLDKELYDFIQRKELFGFLWYREESPRPNGPPNPFPSTAGGIRIDVPATFPMTIFHRNICAPGQVSTRLSLILRKLPEIALKCVLDGECRITSYNTRIHHWYRDSYRYELSIASMGKMELILKGDWEKGA